jgi:hypothetical protein
VKGAVRRSSAEQSVKRELIERKKQSFIHSRPQALGSRNQCLPDADGAGFDEGFDVGLAGDPPLVVCFESMSLPEDLEGAAGPYDRSVASSSFSETSEPLKHCSTDCDKSCASISSDDVSAAARTDERLIIGAGAAAAPAAPESLDTSIDAPDSLVFRRLGAIVFTQSAKDQKGETTVKPRAMVTAQTSSGSMARITAIDESSHEACPYLTGPLGAGWL